MLDLYAWGTGNGRRALVMLEECGLPYTLHKVDITKPRAPEFLKLNPLGAIPVLIDSEGAGGKPLVLAQSGAITLYAAEKTGKFLPKEPAKRAAVHQWFLHAMSDVAPTNGAINQIGMFVPDKAPAAAAYFEGRLGNFFRNADRQLGETEYLAGEISIADLSLYPVVAQKAALVEKIGGLANFSRWLKALAARPALANAMAVTF